MTPQEQEIERWIRAANAGEPLSAGLLIERGSTSETLPVTLHFAKPLTGLKLIDEVADIAIGRRMITCRMAVGLAEPYRTRLKAVLRIIAHYLSHGGEPGFFSASLGDEGLPSRVLAFSSNIPDYLVPDPSFIHSGGYRRQRVAYPRAAPWAQRRDMLYWRGTDTGVWRYRTIERAPRVRACLIARQNPASFSAFITNLENPGKEDLKSFYAQHGLTAQHDKQDEILNYRYQLDIDGNTSAWSGLFLKLLSGSPVLKVDSEWGWRQWYYSRFEAGRHYVPVKADLSDLMQKLSWLRENPREAVRIGEAGRSFALSLTYATELERAARTLARLVQLNGVAAQQVVHQQEQSNQS